MNEIKFFLLGIISLCFISCQQPPRETSTEDETADSSLTFPQDNVITADTVDIPAGAQDAQPSSNDGVPDSTSFAIREGTHYLTLQWISWDELGEAEIEYLGDNKYSIVGEQRNPDNNDYLKINGTLEPISDKKLIFEGIVESQIEHLNQGEPCLKEGPIIFESTKNREYWRMQDMENCEGGMVVDYVDIYF
ncbi:hypothetical protein [Albibacterium profundi]|uniref:Lipoprotein n=1 Tax=Albibacterium profundi TaxID=3134906 RepID=A0ABV5CF20_9SPHI